MSVKLLTKFYSAHRRYNLENKKSFQLNKVPLQMIQFRSIDLSMTTFFSFRLLGIMLASGIRCKLLFYSIIGDCPALKMILEFIAHNGYFCCFYCFYCYIKDVHVGDRGGKRQYYMKMGFNFEIQNLMLQNR